MFEGCFLYRKIHSPYVFLHVLGSVLPFSELRLRLTHWLVQHGCGPRVENSYTWGWLLLSVGNRRSFLVLNSSIYGMHLYRASWLDLAAMCTYGNELFSRPSVVKLLQFAGRLYMKLCLSFVFISLDKTPYYFLLIISSRKFFTDLNTCKNNLIFKKNTQGTFRAQRMFHRWCACSERLAQI